MARSAGRPRRRVRPDRAVQAKTYGNDLARTQVTNNPDNDRQPALAFRPGDGGELVFGYPAASRMPPIVVGTTVLMASATRIYARTEVL